MLTSCVKEAVIIRRSVSQILKPKGEGAMLRFLGSYLIAKLLGGGIILAIIIWLIFFHH